MTDETVWYSANSGSSVYHTQEDCRYVTQTHTTRDRGILDAWGYQHCQLCANNGNPDTYIPSKQSTTRIDVDNDE